MKPTLFSLCIIVNFSVFSQSVTLVPSNPVSPSKGTMLFDNSLNQLKYWNGSAYIPITNAASGTGWGLSSSDIYNSNSGRVFVGASPFGFNAKLNVITGSYNYGLLHSDNNITISSYIGNSGFFGTTSNHPFNLIANNGTQLTITPNNTIGIGVINPVSKLQIGSVGSTGYAGFDFAFGNGTKATGLYHTNNTMQIMSTENISILTQTNSGGQGYLGINTSSPTNKLQIGSVGGSGFATNDFALGNGTNAFAIYQTNTVTLMGSTTNINLKPIQGSGRIGINTSTPRAPLDVATKGNVDRLSNFYTQINEFCYGASDIGFTKYDSPSGTNVPNVSIVTEGNVYSPGFNVYSDSRIKNIKGISNTRQDLQTLNALKITDYTMRDVLNYRNKPFKKVIAQQVETVYPQVVSKHTDFVMNVYQPSISIEKIENGYLLNFNSPHQISKNAKKLKVLMDDIKGIEQIEIVSIPTDKSVVINVKEIKDNRCFVYGEEVDDFHTVDYEGLTTLNISATQELSKLVNKLISENEIMKAEISSLKAMFLKVENTPEIGKK